ncbi:hypothetical protein KEJ26_05470 [Candidatus Bathyarchaeota archaeon]|nr:hypothetical protein [Candidatus Bathyarchaeota archaeon]
MSEDVVLRHYSNPRVQEEIVRFSQDRWIGIHCARKDTQGRPHLVRYLGRAKLPLRISKPEDVPKLLKIFRFLQPRTFYGTANVYKKLSRPEDLFDLTNIKACTPTWDIDNTVEKWAATVEAALEIISFLESSGIRRSIFVKFSGRGAHIHVHQEAISPALRERINPLDLAYALVEYTRLKLQNKFNDIMLRYSADSLRVDNEIDVQRLFTSPLSLHKELDRVCVCIPINELNNFTLAWSRVDDFKHYWGWDIHIPGEADELAQKAYEIVGPCPTLPRFRRRRHPPLDKQITKFLQPSWVF